MTDNTVFDVPAQFAEVALIDARKWKELREESVSDPLTFWRMHGKRLDWVTPYTRVREVSFDPKDLHIRWYMDGTLNASFNCLDRHLKTRGNQTAIIWEGDDPQPSKNVT